jgi:hypothetical protein
MKLALLPKKSKGSTVEMRFDLHFGTLENLRGKRGAARAPASSSAPAPRRRRARSWPTRSPR